VLFVKLGLTKKRKGKTGFSTDARVLQSIRDEHPIIPRIERWRELNQLTKTYLEVLPQLVDERSRIHTTFLQAVATTGRLSSTNPNMQNVPVRTPLGREIRGCFEAEEGHLLMSADYSQVELRVSRTWPARRCLSEIFARGEDVHTATASQVFEKDAADLTPMDRSKAKMINYGIVYGLSDYGLADRLNIPREEAKAFIDAYLERFAAVARSWPGRSRAPRSTGTSTTLFGPAPADPRAARAQLPGPHARASASRSTRSSRAPPPTCSSSAMVCGPARALERDRAGRGWCLTVPRRAAVRGPEAEVDAGARSSSSAEMVAPWEPRQPPLAVDVGVGRTWLEAK
jgi:DNA polymerase-1